MTRHICPPEHKHDQTSTCYVSHKCRCVPCNAANTARGAAQRELARQHRIREDAKKQKWVKPVMTATRPLTPFEPEVVTRAKVRAELRHRVSQQNEFAIEDILFSTRGNVVTGHVIGRPTVNSAYCGTTKGYSGHYERGERPCGPCCEAKRAYRRELTRVRRQAAR